MTSVTQSRVSAVYAKDGSIGRNDYKLFALDGRDAIAEPGTVRFFRRLDVGDRGDDVLQLKQILAASGRQPRSDEHGVHRADPVRARAVAGTASLSGRDAGDADIGDGLADTEHGVHARRADLGRADHRSRGRADDGRDFGRRAPRHADRVPNRRPGPGDRSGSCAGGDSGLEIQSTNAVVSEGAPATFVITASEANTTADITVNLDAEVERPTAATSSCRRHR